MAVLLDERTVNLELDDLYRRVPIVRPAQPLSRAPGWHASDLLRDIALEFGWLKKNTVEYQEEAPGEYPWRWALGQAWEEYWFSFVCRDGSTVWQPGERTVDGISVNADGLTQTLHHTHDGFERVLQEGQLMLEETKHTEKRVRSGAEFLGERMWLHQGRGYCHCYLPNADEAGGVVRWTVCFYRGNYAGSGPIVKQYVIGFDGGEIRGTWNLFRDRMRLLEERGVTPPH